jgi:hypothetical protein
MNQGWSILILKANSNKLFVSKPLKRWGYQLTRKRFKQLKFDAMSYNLIK